MDMNETFSLMKKLGLPVPPMSTKEELEKLNIFSEETQHKYGKSFSEVIDFINYDPEKNKELFNSIQECIKQTWGL